MGCYGGLSGDTVLHLTTKHTIGLYTLVNFSFQLNLKVKQPAVLEVAIHDPSSPLPKSKRSVIIKLFVTVVFSIYLSMWLASRAQQLSPSGLPAAAHAHEGEVCAHDSFVIRHYSCMSALGEEKKVTANRCLKRKQNALALFAFHTTGYGLFRYS